MSILDKLFPKNHIPYADRNVPHYHYDALRSQPKYDAINRPRGMSIGEWNDWVEADVRAVVLKDMDRLEAAANEAAWHNALHYVDHPSEQKWVESWERPSDRLIQAARDYRAGKLK